jgi:TnpA family transposase
LETRELLTPFERKQLFEIPEHMEKRELARYYTLSDEEKQIIKQQHGAPNRLGFAMQIAYLRFPSRPLAMGEQVPAFILDYIAEQIGISSKAMQQYASTRDETRREHLSRIRKIFGYRTFTSQTYKELVRWLLPTVMGTDKGI